MAEGASTSRKGNGTKDRRVPVEPSEEFKQFVKFTERLGVARDQYYHILDEGLGDPEVASDIENIKNDLDIIEHTFATMAVRGIKHRGEAKWMIPLFRGLSRTSYYNPESFSMLARALAVYHKLPELDGDLDLKETLGLAQDLLRDMGDNSRLDEIARERDRALRRKRERQKVTVEAALEVEKTHDRPKLKRDWNRMFG